MIYKLLWYLCQDVTGRSAKQILFGHRLGKEKVAVFEEQDSMVKERIPAPRIGKGRVVSFTAECSPFRRARFVSSAHLSI